MKIPREKQEMIISKIIDMYKVYGTDKVALVNPAENPYILQVKDRKEAEKKQFD
jgi:hypothetical protein